MQIKIKIININGGKRENLNNSGMVISFWSSFSYLAS